MVLFGDAAVAQYGRRKPRHGRVTWASFRNVAEIDNIEPAAVDPGATEKGVLRGEAGRVPGTQLWADNCIDWGKTVKGTTQA